MLAIANAIVLPRMNGVNVMHLSLNEENMICGKVEYTVQRYSVGQLDPSTLSH